MTSLEHILETQAAWSRANFGPGQRQEGVLDHISKEIKEVRESNGDPYEWIDLVILSFDGLLRQLQHESLISPKAAAEKAVKMLLAKHQVNHMRDWPDWRTADPNKAIEHNEPFKKT